MNKSKIVRLFSAVLLTLALSFVEFPLKTYAEPQVRLVEPPPSMTLSVAVAPEITPQLITTPLPYVSVHAESSTRQKSTDSFNLNIPSIGLHTKLDKTQLDSDGHLMVPSNPHQAAWYENGPRIGQSGTALITGHLDSAAEPGVFYNLHKIAVGDEIHIGLENGLVAKYTVDKAVSYPQNNSFPWSEVYSETGPSQIRIITCDGVYSSQTKHYSQNLVVYATLVSIN